MFLLTRGAVRPCKYTRLLRALAARGCILSGTCKFPVAWVPIASCFDGKPSRAHPVKVSKPCSTTRASHYQAHHRALGTAPPSDILSVMLFSLPADRNISIFFSLCSSVASAGTCQGTVVASHKALVDEVVSFYCSIMFPEAPTHPGGLPPPQHSGLRSTSVPSIVPCSWASPATKATYPSHTLSPVSGPLNPLVHARQHLVPLGVRPLPPCASHPLPTWLAYRIFL